jgi:hypothetical protein
MNREQQRQNARDQKRLQQRQKLRQREKLPSQPALGKRPSGSHAKQISTLPESGTRLPKWWPWVAAVAVIILIVAPIYFLDPFGLRTPLPGKKMPSQGNNHVQPGSTHIAYNTDPPNSGPHFDTVPRGGIFTTPFATEFLPHFLEHGGTEVTFNSSASPEAVKKFTDIVNAELDKGLGLVLMSPRPDAPCTVALTSWQRIETFGSSDACKSQAGWIGRDFDPNSSKDAGVIKEFVERNQCVYDPENQCGAGPTGKTIYPTPVAGAPTVTSSQGAPTPVAPPVATPAP